MIADTEPNGPDTKGQIKWVRAETQRICVGQCGRYTSHYCGKCGLVVLGGIVDMIDIVAIRNKT